MNVPEIIYEKDDFSDILKKDDRFDSRAYDFVLDVINEACTSAKGHVTGQELLEFFRGTVFLSAKAADAVNARGFSAYTGVQVRPWQGARASVEVTENISAMHSAVYNYKADILGESERYIGAPIALEY